jgi:hypothetical protein
LNGQSPLYALAALILAIGLAAGGWLIGQGFRESRIAERYVTVKGTSERTVKADLALWPIRFVATGDDLAQVQAKLVKDAATIRQLLSSAGLTEKDIELQRLDVTDLLAQAYRSGPVDSRFIVAQTLMARSPNVDQIAAAGQRLSELVDAGVVLSNEFGPGGPVYLFTKLNDIKPEMIAEATQNARAAAEQFANDSGANIGGIRRANQGLFEILPRDRAPQLTEETQVEKTVRVVSTIDYLLVD